MDKLSIFRTAGQNFKKNLRMSSHMRQGEYHDRFLQTGEKVPFKHSVALLAHMHDLRVWTLAYSPSRKNNLTRMQELHRLNAEMNYLISDALWKRGLMLIVFILFVTKMRPGKYMNQGNFDSHDANWRDAPPTI